MEQYEISYVTEQGLSDAQNKFSGSLKTPADIIHGHTHRPAIHTHFFKNQEYRRFVLPDWYENKGGCLIVWLNPTFKNPTGWLLCSSTGSGSITRESEPSGTSLVVQWLRIRLPMQGTLEVPALDRFDS